MSQGVVMRHVLGTTRMMLPEFPAINFLRYISKKKFIPPPAKETEKNKEVSHTTVILQDRLDIQEVPTIVRKARNVEQSEGRAKFNATLSTFGSNEEEEKPSILEEEEILQNLAAAHTLDSLYAVLDVVSDDDFTSEIALSALQRIIEVENNSLFRNKMQTDEDSRLNLKRPMVLDRLTGFVISDPRTNVILKALDILSRDNVGAPTAEYKRKFINELLIRSNDRKFTVREMCQIVNLLFLLKSDDKMKYVDELWTGFIDRTLDINENNAAEVFSVLPKLKQSRKMVFNMLERRISDIWWQLPSSIVAEILTVLGEVQISSPHTCLLLARNVSSNIHSVSEDELLRIVNGFSACNYIDETVETLLQKYVKTKGPKMKNDLLVGKIIEYCTKFNCRVPCILEKCAECIANSKPDLSPILFKSLIVPLGHFNFHPPNAVKFWQVVENFFSDKFVQFRPIDIVDIALACIYLEKYPVNITKKILNPYFLDRIHTCTNKNELQNLRSKLKLFDTAMTLECPQYLGPILPRDYAVKTISQDGRVKRLVSIMYDVVSDLVGTCKRVSTGVLVPKLPTMDLYIVDILLHPVGITPSSHDIELPSNRDVYIALLIHLPEHYCSDEEHLIGLQVMKKRHLRRLGFSVLSLKYSALIELKGNIIDLHNYLINKLEEVEEAIQ